MSEKAIIEIPMHSRYKYEIHEGKLVLDRPIGKIIPVNYGYIPSTLAEDGDPLDCFVISKYAIISGAECKVHVVGAFRCTDQEIPDHKLIATLDGEFFKSTLPEIDQIKEYLETYKKGFKVLEFVGESSAEKMIADCLEKAIGSSQHDYEPPYFDCD